MLRGQRDHPDDVREANGTSNSHFRHLPRQEALVRAVIALRGQM